MVYGDETQILKLSNEIVEKFRKEYIKLKSVLEDDLIKQTLGPKLYGLLMQKKQSSDINEAIMNNLELISVCVSEGGFDLEATKRERNYLRDYIEKNDGHKK